MMSQVRSSPPHAVHASARRRPIAFPACPLDVQVVTCLLRRAAEADVVPILVKVQQLQRRLLASPDAFVTAWNWVDAYLRLELDKVVYRMLRQAMAARRAILLLECPAVGTPTQAPPLRRLSFVARSPVLGSSRGAGTVVSTRQGGCATRSSATSPRCSRRRAT